jgi:hypothetical protein
MRKLITVIILTLVLFNSCKKDEQKSNTDLLTGKYWKITELTVSPGFPVFDAYGNITGYTDDIYAQMEACAKDDTRKYNADGTYIWDAKIKCAVDDVQSGSGTWMFNTDETVITETGNGESISYTIIELTDSRYKFSYDMVLDAVTYKLTVTRVPE